MRQMDIVVVGGGLAGSTAAAMLGRAGYRVAMIDPHPVYPPDFRCEKLDSVQTRILVKTGLADAVLRAGTRDGESWVARQGRLVEKRPGDQLGILYDTLVMALRDQIPPETERVYTKVSAVSVGPDRQIVTTADGDVLSARLVVLANGLNVGLRQSMGLEREVISPCHSVTIGFNLTPRDRPSFPFSSLTYYPERTADRMAYLSLFPVGSAMRANFMVYRELRDPWVEQFRDAPEQSMLALMPRLQRLTGEFQVTGYIKTRPADLYVTKGYRKPGVVLVGDAFATSCPAAGTGTGKVFTDVERLCNVHVPAWLATDGMDEAKIAAFYDDPVKRAYDTFAINKAYDLRSLSIDDSLPWRARRWARFGARMAMGAWRQVSGRASAPAAGSSQPVAPSHSELGRPA